MAPENSKQLAVDTKSVPQSTVDSIQNPVLKRLVNLSRELESQDALHDSHGSSHSKST